MPYLKFKGSRIFYTIQGEGQPVIMIHGFLGSGKIFKDTCKFLSKKFQVIIPDLPGHGKSENIGYFHSMEMMAEGIKFLCDILNVNKIILAGHSMGGYVSLAFAEYYPDMLKGICLINSGPFEDDSQKKTDRKRAINLVKSNHNVFLGDTIKNLFSKEYFHLNLTAVRNAEAIAKNTSKRGIVAALEGMRERKDRSFILKKMIQNCFFISGNHDKVITEKIRKKISDILPESNIHLLMKSGHMSLLEEKTVVNTILEKIFSEIQISNP